MHSIICWLVSYQSQRIGLWHFYHAYGPKRSLFRSEAIIILICVIIFAKRIFETRLKEVRGGI